MGKVLEITSSYWVRVGEKYSWEVRLKDMFGDKYEISIWTKRLNKGVDLEKSGGKLVNKEEKARIDEVLNTQMMKIYEEVQKKGENMLNELENFNN